MENENVVIKTIYAPSLNKRPADQDALAARGIQFTDDLDTANNLVNTMLPEGTDANGIYWKALTPNVKNKAGALSL